jgi:hypothetical protein
VTVEHFLRLCGELGQVQNIFKHYASTLGSSKLPQYRKVILASGPEILSVRNPIQNKQRRYIAGLDDLEPWDREQISKLGLPLQMLS